MDYKMQLINFSDTQNDNDNIRSDEGGAGSNKTGVIDLPANIQERIPSKVLDYYKVLQHCEFIWTYKKKSGIRGFLNIIPLRDPTKVTLEDYQYGLTIFDNFVPEACVGYYVAEPGETPNEELYFLYFEDKPQPLNLDVEGYMQLLYLVRGFAYWQDVILFLQGNPEAMQSSVDEFKTYMPQVFPDFKWEDFVALYEKVKLRK